MDSPQESACFLAVVVLELTWKDLRTPWFMLDRIAKGTESCGRGLYLRNATRSSQLHKEPQLSAAGITKKQIHLFKKQP